MDGLPKVPLNLYNSVILLGLSIMLSLNGKSFGKMDPVVVTKYLSRHRTTSGTRWLVGVQGQNLSPHCEGDRGLDFMESKRWYHIALGR